MEANGGRHGAGSDSVVVLTLGDMTEMGRRAGAAPGERRAPLPGHSLLAMQGSAAALARRARCTREPDERARARAYREKLAAEEMKRLDALSAARRAEHERLKHLKAEGERRLELGRRKLDDRRKHARRQARDVDRENERLLRALSTAKAMFASKDEIDALQGRVS